MPEKVVFDWSLEGLFLRGLTVTPALRAELLGLGIDLAQKLPESVSRETWYRALDAATRHGFPTLERGAALREIGVLLMRGIEETFMGRTLAPIMRLLGVLSFLDRLPGYMKWSNNFADGKLTRLGERFVCFEVSDVGDAPEVMQGSLEEMARWCGAKTVEVTFSFESPPAARYLVRWAE